MLKVTPKVLMIVAGIITLISTVGFIIIIPILNERIDSLQQKTNELNGKLDAYSFNYIMEANQKAKMASTDGALKILDTLNSSYKKEFENHLRRQMYQGIVIMRNERFTSSEIKNLDTMSFANLERIYKEQSDNSTKDYTKILKERNENENKTEKIHNLRYLFTVIFGGVQIFGLLLAILADYFKEA